MSVSAPAAELPAAAASSSVAPPTKKKRKRLTVADLKAEVESHMGTPVPHLNRPRLTHIGYTTQHVYQIQLNGSRVTVLQSFLSVDHAAESLHAAHGLEHKDAEDAIDTVLDKLHCAAFDTRWVTSDKLMQLFLSAESYDKLAAAERREEKKRQKKAKSQPLDLPPPKNGDGICIPESPVPSDADADEVEANEEED